MSRDDFFALIVFLVVFSILAAFAVLVWSASSHEKQVRSMAHEKCAALNGVVLTDKSKGGDRYACLSKEIVVFTDYEAGK